MAGEPPRGRPLSSDEEDDLQGTGASVASPPPSPAPPHHLPSDSLPVVQSTDPALDSVATGLSAMELGTPLRTPSTSAASTSAQPGTHDARPPSADPVLPAAHLPQTPAVSASADPVPPLTLPPLYTQGPGARQSRGSTRDRQSSAIPMSFPSTETSSIPSPAIAQPPPLQQAAHWSSSRLSRSTSVDHQRPDSTSQGTPQRWQGLVQHLGGRPRQSLLLAHRAIAGDRQSRGSGEASRLDQRPGLGSQSDQVPTTGLTSAAGGASQLDQRPPRASQLDQMPAEPGRSERASQREQLSQQDQRPSPGMDQEGQEQIPSSRLPTQPAQPPSSAAARPPITLETAVQPSSLQHHLSGGEAHSVLAMATNLRRERDREAEQLRQAEQQRALEHQQQLAALHSAREQAVAETRRASMLAQLGASRWEAREQELQLRLDQERELAAAAAQRHASELEEALAAQRERLSAAVPPSADDQLSLQQQLEAAAAERRVLAAMLEDLQQRIAQQAAEAVQLRQLHRDVEAAAQQRRGDQEQQRAEMEEALQAQQEEFEQQRLAAHSSVQEQLMGIEEENQQLRCVLQEQEQQRREQQELARQQQAARRAATSAAVSGFSFDVPGGLPQDLPQDEWYERRQRSQPGQASTSPPRGRQEQLRGNAVPFGSVLRRAALSAATPPPQSPYRSLLDPFASSTTSLAAQALLRSPTAVVQEALDSPLAVFVPMGPPLRSYGVDVTPEEREAWIREASHLPKSFTCPDKFTCLLGTWEATARQSLLQVMSTSLGKMAVRIAAFYWSAGDAYQQGLQLLLAYFTKGSAEDGRWFKQFVYDKYVNDPAGHDRYLHEVALAFAEYERSLLAYARSRGMSDPMEWVDKVLMGKALARDVPPPRLPAFDYVTETYRLGSPRFAVDIAGGARLASTRFLYEDPDIAQQQDDYRQLIDRVTGRGGSISQHDTDRYRNTVVYSVPSGMRDRLFQEAAVVVALDGRSGEEPSIADLLSVLRQWQRHARTVRDQRQREQTVQTQEALIAVSQPRPPRSVPHAALVAAAPGKPTFIRCKTCMTTGMHSATGMGTTDTPCPVEKYQMRLKVVGRGAALLPVRRGHRQAVRS